MQWCICSALMIHRKNYNFPINCKLIAEMVIFELHFFISSFTLQALSIIFFFPTIHSLITFLSQPATSITINFSLKLSVCIDQCHLFHFEDFNRNFSNLISLMTVYTNLIRHMLNLISINPHFLYYTSII